MGMSVAAFLPALNNGAKMMYPKVVSNRNTDKQQQVYDDDSFGDDNGDGDGGSSSIMRGENPRGTRHSQLSIIISYLPCFLPLSSPPRC